MRKIRVSKSLNEALKIANKQNRSFLQDVIQFYKLYFTNISKLLYNDYRHGGVGNLEATSTLDIQKVSQILKLLGDKTRLTIMKLLETNECCVCEFVAIFNTSQPAISQHLRKLRDAGLVKENRKGQWIFYSTNKENEYYPFIKELLGYLPAQDNLITDLEAQGLRISCE
ncbi:winged helix-turn-helix transcriptional regulator [Bacillus sp. PAMC26568]|nr:winged helix-turn-helix transcriptional regulator [Bacillus sp. PAMC26568]